MKKAKFFKKFLLLILIIPVIFMFSACGTSAYELAVNNGFKGTEQEWLASLKGKSAYEIAVENGFEGTEKQWLASLNGVDGTNGKDGKDAEKLSSYDLYEDAVERGEFTGDYLAFLKTLTGSEQDEVSAMVNERMFSVFSLEASGRVGQTKNAGSAVLYKFNQDGTSYFITNCHMVSGNYGTVYSNLTLFDYSQTTGFQATLVGGSMTYDIAVLKLDKASTDIIKASGSTPAPIATDYYIGETCYAIGNTRDLGLAATRGMISRDSEYVSMNDRVYRVFRHDSFIYHGNSGGGIFDSNGNLLGITNGGVEELVLLNFAIPATLAANVADNIIRNSSNVSASELASCCTFDLGFSDLEENSVEIKSVSSSYNSDTCRAEVIENIFINSISADSLIDKYNANQDSDETKILSGDKLVSIEVNGKVFKITRSFQISELLLTAKIGDTLTVTVERDGKTISASTLFERSCCYALA